MLKRAIFLDRDGVINIDHGYVYQQENFEFVDGVFELVAAAKKAGFLIIVVTNQAGIGRGYYTEQDFNQLMRWVSEEFSRREGAIDRVYFCPDHPEHGIGKYQRDSYFRKPRPGMLFQAAAELNIDLKKSFLVGDKISDVEAGISSGIGKIFLLSKNLKHNTAILVDSLKDIMSHIV